VLVTLPELRAAQERLRGVAVHTPLVRLEPGLESRLEPYDLWIKAEALQPIGSFKLRGAFNKIVQLSAQERAYGVITYSSSGRILRSSSTGHKSGHRDAIERAAG
jgi:threonine dehydratase